MIDKVFIVGFIVLSFYSFGQDTDSTKRIKFLPVPSIGYSPETRYYLGAVVLSTFSMDKHSRSSNAKIEFVYTWNQQMILDQEWNVFARKDRLFTQGLLHFSKYPDTYFGSDQQEEDAISYQSKRFKLDGMLLWKPRDNWYLGGALRTVFYGDVSAEQQQVTYAEITNAATVGASAIAQLDKRNSLLTPSKGYYVRLSTSFNYSTSFYQQLAIDARIYKALLKKNKFVLSNRVLAVHSIGALPFFDLAALGGDRIVRGYFYGRFRDQHMSTFQSELRYTVYKWFGLAAFGGVSAVYSPPQKWDANFLKPNAGIGLRFRVDKNEGTNLRFDYAIGKDGQSGFYVSFGESF